MRFAEMPLPDNWPPYARSAMLHAAFLAQAAIVYSRSWCANSPIARARLAGKLDQAHNEITLLQEELRIKNARLAKIPPHQRPFYAPTERMAILELKAAHGWNQAQTAQAFLVEPETIAAWLKRLDDPADGLVQITPPVNRFPQFVGQVVRKLKVLCPAMGKQRLAETLAKAGLHLAATTVGRFLKTPSASFPPSSLIHQPSSLSPQASALRFQLTSNGLTPSDRP